MVRITKREQVEERRQKVWEFYTLGYRPSEIARIHLHQPQKTVSNDLSFMRKKRAEERRCKAEQQEHEAKEVIEQERGTLDILKRQALIDYSQLSMQKPDERDYRLEMYSVIGMLSDSRVDLALMLDRLEQKETLQRIKAKSNSIRTELTNIERGAGIDNITTDSKGDSKQGHHDSDNNLLQKESQVY